MLKFRSAGVCTLVLLTAPAACGSPGTDRATEGVRAVIEEAGDFALDGERPSPVREEVAEFYRAREYGPLWVHDRGANSRGEGLLETLHASADEGLPPERYRVSLVEAEIERIREGNGDEDLERRLGSLEVALTTAWLRYTEDLARGHIDPEEAGLAWLIPRPEAPGPGVLDRVVEGEHPAAVAAELRPRNPQYASLRAALRHYREVEEAGGWPRVPEEATLREGDEGDDVAVLRDRLIAEGNPVERPLAEGGLRPDHFDADLRAAVENLQARYALEPDGIVGGRTLEELNRPVSERIQDLKMNLDRWRWLPRDLGERYVLVNVAGYELEVIEDETPVLSMAVIVGEEAWETPVFADTLDHLAFNPYWNVPQSIAEARILPEVRENPEYLARNNMEVLDRSGATPEVVRPRDVDWDAHDNGFPYWFRQRPGPTNALGQVKFMFPNEHNIYLHDTPETHLFAEARRAFSHGCIRVEKPWELARYLLRTDSDRSPEEIDELRGHDTEIQVQLQRSIPIYILYFTAWAEEDGVARFHHDPYHQDRRLEVEAEAAETPPAEP